MARVRVRVRVRARVRLKCDYYDIGVHTYHSLRFRVKVWVRVCLLDARVKWEK